MKSFETVVDGMLFCGNYEEYSQNDIGQKPTHRDELFGYASRVEWRDPVCDDQTQIKFLIMHGLKSAWIPHQDYLNHMNTGD